MSRLKIDPRPSHRAKRPSGRSRLTQAGVVAVLLMSSPVLAGSGSIAGTITDEMGTPVASELVRIFDDAGGFVGLDFTDSSGAYSRTGLATGDYFVASDSNRHFNEVWDDVPCPLMRCDVTTGTAVAVVDGATTGGIDFELGPGGTLSGFILEEGTLAPIAAFARLYNESGTFESLVGTDSTGAYFHGGLPTGTYIIEADDLEYFNELWNDIPCPISGLCDRTTGTPIAVVFEQDTTGIDLILSIGGQISGRVVDQLGAPISGIFLRAYAATGTYAALDSTDSNGQYAIKGLPTGTFFVTAQENGSIYAPEVYDDILCEGCDPTIGTPVTVIQEVVTPDIDFELAPGMALIFADGFESGDTSGWL